MKKYLLTIALVLIAACELNSSSYADIAGNTLPDLNSAINGTVENITSGGTTTGLNVITQGGTGAVGQFDWNTFDVGKDMTVNWAFTGQAQTALNRVLSNNLSQIYGKLTSSCAVGNCTYGNSSKVILINPNGLLFGNGSQVNINSFTASTFDAVGARNIKDLGSDHSSYAAGLQGKFGYNQTIRFQGSTSAPGSTVKLEGSTWNIDKSAAIVAKDIVVYKDSLIATNLNYNYGNGTQNFSNVKLVTSNGVDFKYLAGGYIENGSVNVLPGLDGVNYTMQIGSDNPAVNTANHGTGAQYDAKISSGNVLIHNAGKTAGSNIKIQKAAIKGNKLVNYANGDIAIIAEGQIDIDDSNIETHNTYKIGDASVNTYAALGGNIDILGKKGIDVADSRIATAYSSTNASPAGNITLQAETSGDIKAKSSSIVGQGDVLLKANQGSVNLDTAIVQAENMIVPANLKTLEVFGKNGVTATSSNLSASKDATVNSTNGDVSLVGNGKIYAGNNLNLYGNNTLVERSALSYNNLNLYNGAQVNNVTFKGTTTLQDRDSTTGLVINTNGNLIVDGNELKTRTPGQAYADAQNQTKITLNSAKNITVKNASSVKSPGEITMNANNGDVTVVDSTVKSIGSNVNLNASKSNNVTNSTVEAALNNNLIATTANNVTDSYLTASKNNVLTAAAANIDCSELTAENNDVKGTAGSVAVKNSKVSATNNNTLVANNDFTSTNSIFNAKANAITSTTGAASFTNSRLIATDSNNVKARGNITFKYDSTSNKQCVGAGCDGPLNNAVTAGLNTINSTNGNIDISNTPVTATVGSNTITANLGDVKIKDSILDAKGDNTVKGNNVDIECSDLIATNNKSEAVSGNQTVTNTNATASNNNTFSASNNYTTVNSIYTAKNNTITAVAGKIDATNVKIAATTGKNTISAKGNVTFDYNSALNKQCTGAGCDGPVGTELKGNNDITSTDGDVTMTGKLTPNDPTKPENTTTTITAGGDVKTKARVVYDDLYDKTGTIIGQGPLDTQGTKLIINTKGNVNLVLTNTDNVKAGLEIANASTNPLKNNKVEVIAQDGTLAISRIVTDDLFIHQPNYHLAGTTVLSAADKAVDSYAPTNSPQHQTASGVEADMSGRAYIEVRHGFNQDYEPSKVEQSGIYQASFNERTIAGGTVYGKHFINLPDGDDTAVKGEFVLSYTKPYECDPEPPMEPEISYNIPEEIGKVTIPLEADIYQQGIITNNLTDPSIGIIAAAASIVVEDEEQQSQDY